MHNLLHAFFVLLTASQFIVGILLVLFVTMQEGKNDGLTGQIGSGSTSTFKGKAGRQEHLNIATRNTAIVFMVISTLVAICYKRW